MHRLRFRFPQLLLLLALPAAAIAEPPPPPAAPAPEPIPYPNTAARDHASGLPTGKRMHKPFVAAAEPVTLDVSNVSWAAANADSLTRLSSDPEEGGEIAAAKTKVHVSEINVTKHTDVASPKLALDEPAPSGTATVTVARGACASGKHFPAVKIVTRSASYTLNDVDATQCTDSGETTTCTLTYQSVAF